MNILVVNPPVCIYMRSACNTLQEHKNTIPGVDDDNATLFIRASLMHIFESRPVDTIYRPLPEKLKPALQVLSHICRRPNIRSTDVKS